MKIIQISVLFICGLFLIIGTGCDTFLNKTDPSNFNRDSYYTQASHAEAAINAIYESLYSIHNTQAYLITELRTGIANSTFAADAGYPNFRLVRELSMSSDHPSLEVFWNSHYRGIGNANIALLEIPNIQMDETQKNRLLGEAQFLRAYYYFNLVRLFGDIPLIEEPIDLGSSGLNSGRMPVETIYRLIVQDLTMAEQSGLPFIDNSGRVTLGAVKSLLAEVYLTMAGFPLDLGAEYYTLARDKAREVIDSEEYYLFDEYDAFRSYSTENLGEFIFSVQFDEVERRSNSLQIGLIPFRRDVSAYSLEEGFRFAQREFVESYEPNDKRAQEGQFFFSQYTSEKDRSIIVDFGEYYIFKFFDEIAHNITAQSGLNWQVIRYADVLLDYAEASNEISGPTSEAYEAINKIRNRAGLSNYSGLSQSEFREAIWREGWHEMCFEGKIWFDIVRTRKVFDYTAGIFNDYVGHVLIGGKTVEGKHLLFPIPTTEIRNNINLVQNQGY